MFRPYKMHRRCGDCSEGAEEQRVAEAENEQEGKAKTDNKELAAYGAIGSAILYFLGYFSLRFHLTVLGIGADLAVLDERYLFAGAKFLVYTVAVVPSMVLVGLLLVVVLFFPYRVLTTRLGKRWHRPCTWGTHPTRLALLGIVIAVLVIQLVMKQCFFFSNLLLARALPEPRWLSALLLEESDGGRVLYFTGLVLGAAVTAGLLFLTRKRDHITRCPRALVWLLAVLVAVQCLLLPINYGVLIMDKTMPRVASLGGQELKVGQEAWLVWEGKDSVTYLLREGQDQRTLLTLPRKKVAKIDIVAYDRLLRMLFLHGQKQLPSASDANH